ncbi:MULTISPECIES: ABC transporter substrate-binding protein [Nocardioides]|uniref:ABC transporter substrate-binding protein n=1 Tax=Nocardioides vastitatis TaxID=2568655 RepID=A0ABW0ZJT5_9ACTN|nr:ABC transporter substrate-binding protein [Nocardioides sp.]THJ04490.1 branched-chain amino acid ABC transporter substrate-binding protein [Nocardioides sp.]
MKRFRTAVAAGLLTATALTACAPGGDSADEEGPIKVGMIADLSGPTSDVGSRYHKGMLGYVKWLNGEGGVDGREIEALAEDYAYDVPTAERLYKKFVNEGAVAIQGWGTGDTEALSSKITADHLPFMSASYAEELTDPGKTPYNFVVAPTYSDQMRVALNWIAEDGGGKADVAFFHNDSPFGLAPLDDARTWIDEKGLEVDLEAYPMPAGAANYVGLLSQAKSQGAKYIVIQNVSSPAAQVAKDIAAQNLDMKIVCLNWCADELFIETAGKAAEGHVLVQPWAPANSGVEGHAVIDEFLKGEGSSLAEEGLHYAQGWYTMHAMVEGVRGAIEEEDLSGEAIKDALENAGSIDTGGAIGDGAIEFTADSHRGSSATGIYEVKKGEMTALETGVAPE